MRTRICKEMSRLASAHYWGKYVSSGTREEYVLPEEMIDSVVQSIVAVRGSNDLSREFTNEELGAIEVLLNTLRKATEEYRIGANASEACRQPAVQHILQDAATRCLHVFGVTLEDADAIAESS